MKKYTGCTIAKNTHSVNVFYIGICNKTYILDYIDYLL